MLRFFYGIMMYLLFALFFNIDSLAISLDKAIASQKVRPLNGSVIVANDERILYQKAAGLADEKNPVELDHKFIIASVSKQITAALVLREHEKGTIDIDAPIGNYFPELQMTWKDSVTVHHLLSHTSGIVALNKPLKSIPGERFAYSNLGYIMLGQLLERIHHKKYGEITQELFALCGMQNSLPKPANNLLEIKHQVNHLAQGYYEDKKRRMQLRTKFDNLAFNPTGGIISNVFDLWQWNRCLHLDTLVLHKETLDRMLTPYCDRKYRLGNLGYGYGIHVTETDGVIEIFHGGFIKGYISSLYYYPQAKITVAILENKSLRGSGNRVYYVQDLVRKIVRGYVKKSTMANQMMALP